MKKLMTAVGSWCLMAGAALAAPISAELTTDPAISGGDDPSYASRYSAYLCTKEAAATYFGGNTGVDTIGAWLAEETGANFWDSVQQLKAADAGMKYYGVDEGEFSFTKYFQNPLEGDNIALLSYLDPESSDVMYRVFANAADGGLLEMNDKGAGTAGAWMTTAVPEPTSGLLLLFGLAGLALRRKRV